MTTVTPNRPDAPCGCSALSDKVFVTKDGDLLPLCVEFNTETGEATCHKADEAGNAVMVETANGSFRIIQHLEGCVMTCATHGKRWPSD